MNRLILFCLSVVLLFSGCQVVEEPKMPQEIPEDFQFHIKYGIEARNEINTFTQTVVKDLISAGTTELQNFQFTEQEWQDIWSEIQKINLEQEKKLLVNSNCRMTPYSSYHLTIQYDGKIKQLSFSNENCELTKDAEELRQWINYISQLVEQKPEYQELPEAVGGYE